MGQEITDSQYTAHKNTHLINIVTITYKKNRQLFISNSIPLTIVKCKSIFLPVIYESFLGYQRDYIYASKRIQGNVSKNAR